MIKSELGFDSTRGADWAGTSCILRFTHGSVIEWGFFCQSDIGNLRNNSSMIFDSQPAICRNFPYSYRIYLPFIENVKNLVFAPFFSDQEHPFLRLAQHNLIRSHAALTLWNELKVNFDSSAGPPSHFTGRASESGRTHVLDAHNRPGFHGLQAGFQQEFFQERISHLNIRAFAFGFCVKFRGSHGGTVNTVASCFGSNINDGIAHA